MKFFFLKKTDLFCGGLGRQAAIRPLLCVDDRSHQEFRPFHLRRRELLGEAKIVRKIAWVIARARCVCQKGMTG
jgi:hypothetical protein